MEPRGTGWHWKISQTLAKNINPADLRALTRRTENELALGNLDYFIRMFWNVVETKQLVWGWHLDAIAIHLEAVYRGIIKRLIINIPPRHMKSLSVSVFFPAWVWLQNPSERFLFSSYAQSLSTRDSVKMRRIIESPRYKELMAMAIERMPEEKRRSNKFYLEGDQNTKTRYENNWQGYRIATSTEGSNTGEGGDMIIVDDPHNVVEAESESVRNGVLTWWDEAMSNRVNDINACSYIIMMQRVHENDLVGHVLDGELGHQWDHLCLPALYEGENRVVSSLGFVDPRTEMDEPLFSNRFSLQNYRDWLLILGPYAFAGQYQQRPSPRQGGMFSVENLKVVNYINPDNIEAVVRYWDKAGTEGAGKRTAGVKMCKLRKGVPQFVVLDVVKGQWSSAKRELMIKQTAELDGPNVIQWLEQEPGSGGKESAENTIRSLAGLPIFRETVTGAKEVRAEPYSAQVEGENVALLSGGTWQQEYIAELRMFPNGKFSDQVDASSGAFNKLALPEKKKQVGMW